MIIVANCSTGYTTHTGTTGLRSSSVSQTLEQSSGQCYIYLVLFCHKLKMHIVLSIIPRHYLIATVCLILILRVPSTNLFLSALLVIVTFLMHTTSHSATHSLLFSFSTLYSNCSGISWTMCKSFSPRSRQITTPAPHHPFFLQPRCSS